MNTILEIHNLSAGYRHPIIRDISLRIASGELVCLLGRNGCGKTTLCRAVLGDARIYGGTVQLSGKDITSLSVRERARLAASVSQQNTASPGLRAADVIAMGGYAGGSLLGKPSAETLRRIEEFSAVFGVSDYMETDCAALSAGQRQLVHLTRAAVQNTPLILLDEPNSALDFDNTHRFLTLLGDLIRREGRGALLILHDPALALRFADRILLMDAGKLCGEIRPHEADEAGIRTALAGLYPRIRIVRDRDSGHFFCDYDTTLT
ncbi:MAG: ABC transporter ATP-binding protein [Ruminococcaceae bacterium]|nr:ABC transporter ATP-binding protein [Oscillospiraceae bacterium]